MGQFREKALSRRVKSLPPDLDLTAVEVWRSLPCAHTPQEGRVVLHSSDAHYLGDILEAQETIELPERSVNGFLSLLRQEWKP
jgi:hypothetical protein